ncbi:MAG: GIY-YIG nuclease family protein [bacterium]|nr:GIY-YIG nuclease family protein [bacterium]
MEKRLHTHNNLKSGAHYTKIRRPVKLVYMQRCRTYKKARTYEAEFKRMTREEKIEFISKK